jgi:serine/threonine protein kinase
MDEQRTHLAVPSEGVPFVNSHWQPGELIGGRWEVQEVRRGGMGVVYVVIDHETGEKLAAKTYRDDVLNSDVLHRFEKEARVWLKIPPHPNAILAKQFKIVENRPFLFLEYAEDGSLRERIGTLNQPTVDVV